MSDHPVVVPAAAPPASGGVSAAVRRVVRGRVVRYGFVAVAVGLGAYAVVRSWPSVRAGLAGLGPWPVAGAMVCVLGAMVAAMQVWRVLLAGLGSPLPALAAARVVFVGQLGKYLPGSVWPVLAQMELARAHQVPRSRSGTASVLSLLVSLLAGLLTALVTLPFVIGANAPYRWAFLAAPVLLVLLHPKVFNPLLAALLRLVRRPAPEPVTGRAVVTAFGWALVSWVLYGAQIWLLVTRLGAPDGRGALLALGGFAFAWSVGFLVVFAPAGAGVREVVLVATLGTVIGVGDATAIALVSRGLMTVGDLVTAGVVGWSGRRHDH
jgi:uncharacterized membrane protein YbhN (UPF0104 family)